MSVLDSTSTLPDIKAEYFNNASYEEDASVAKAKAFITACRFLLEKIVDASVGSGGESFSIRTEKYEREIQAAQRFIAVRADPEDGGAGAKDYSLEDFRV